MTWVDEVSRTYRHPDDDAKGRAPHSLNFRVGRGPRPASKTPPALGRHLWRLLWQTGLATSALLALLLLWIWGFPQGDSQIPEHEPGTLPLLDAAIAQLSSPSFEPSLLEREYGQPPSLQGPALRAPREMFELLKQRKSALDERERTMFAEHAKLAALQEQIQSLLARHDQAVQLESALDEKRQAAEAARQAEEERRRAEEEEKLQDRLKQMAKIYEAMPPEEAATRLEKLPIPTALKVLKLLRSRAAGNILAQVSPDKAAKLTEQYLTK